MSKHQGQPVSVKFISLGCPKNLVDSEIMAGRLGSQNFIVKPSDAPADVGIVNTCGFIEASKQESIESILELAKQKESGDLKLLIVAGCLSQRYKEELPRLLPEVDAFIGTGDFSRLGDLIVDKMHGKKKGRNFIREPKELPTADNPRIYSTPFYTRYLKISEGCSHECSFCTIPLMRGGLKSRDVSDVLAEMQQGIDLGVKEFNLIAQDLNEYGRDLPKRESLYHLLSQMALLKGDFWIRPLYMYPLQFPDKLIRLMKDHPHLVKYVDIPLQHIDEDILKSMKRGSSSKYIHRLLNELRHHMPEVVLRTTFIVGYPGETDEKFERLYRFVQETQFDNMGVFTYSQEEGTRAATLADPVDSSIAAQRQDRLMALQQGISLKKNKRYVGQKLKILFEGMPTEVPGEAPVPLLGVGRFFGQAPEIDGQVYITESSLIKTPPPVGSFIEVMVTGALPYDLMATPLYSEV